jgi:hypothetical protein
MIERAHARRGRADAAEPSDQRDVRRTSRRTSRLTVGAADDALEREADRVADEVIARMPASCFDGRGPTRIVRSTATSRVEPEVGYEGGATSPQLAGRIGSASGWSAAPRRAPRPHGARFRCRLRRRSDPRRQPPARPGGGRGVHPRVADPLRPGRYDPASRAGQRLLAHELTHVVQQTGHVRRMSPVIQRDLGFEFESDGFRTRPTHNKGGSLPATPFPDAGTAMATFSRNGTTRVAKGKALLAKPDIEIQADDRGTDSDLEAVTTHFPETTNGRQRLAQAMNDLELLIGDGTPRRRGRS